MKYAIYCRMKLSEILRERRTLLRLTQTDLADITGLSVRTISDIEKGKGNPSLSSIEKVATVLGMDIIVVVKQVPEL